MTGIGKAQGPSRVNRIHRTARSVLPRSRPQSLQRSHLPAVPLDRPAQFLVLAVLQQIVEHALSNISFTCSVRGLSAPVDLV
jgi:hypothetical protein